MGLRLYNNIVDNNGRAKTCCDNIIINTIVFVFFFYRYGDFLLIIAIAFVRRLYNSTSYGTKKGLKIAEKKPGHTLY